MTSADAGPGRRTVELFGVPIDVVDMNGAVALAREAVATGRPHQHVVINAAKVVAMRDDPNLAAIVRSCDFIQADGMPIVWFSRLVRRPLPCRVAGADLFEQLVAAAATDGRSVYFLGARPKVVEDVVRVFTRRHPGLRVAGRHDGFWTDDASMVEEIRSCAPDYLFLAIPSPKKEFWLNQHLTDMGVPFVMGVGGSFDVVAGEIRRAPRLLQQIGMEWSWRLLHEPRRMFKRYLKGNTRFLKECWLEWSAIRNA